MPTKSENRACLGEFTPGPVASKWFAREGILRAYLYEIPLKMQFRGITSRDGLILEGPAGLGEAAPFWNYPPDVALRWFRGALDVATRGLPGEPQPVALNVTVPVTDPETAFELVRASGCRTAKVKVADPRVGLEEDLARLQAVRRALGQAGSIRVDANALWTLPEALETLPQLEEAAGGLEYAEQPCAELADLCAVQEATCIPVAADESLRLSENPAAALLAILRTGLAAVIVKAMPLAGPRRAAQLWEEASGNARPVVSSALDTGVGLVAGMSLATRLKTTAACGLGTGRLLEGGILVQEPRSEFGRLVAPKKQELDTGLQAPSALLESRWRARLEDIATLESGQLT